MYALEEYHCVQSKGENNLRPILYSAGSMLANNKNLLLQVQTTYLETCKHGNMSSLWYFTSKLFI